MAQENNNRRKYFFANQMHREIFILIFAASLVPILITAIAVFYLIFHIAAEQIAIPESIAYNLIPAAKKVGKILFLVLPVVIVVIFTLAYKATHKTVGPFDRVVRELDECLAGTRNGPIMLRNKDKFWPLVDKINRLLTKVNSKS